MPSDEQERPVIVGLGASAGGLQALTSFFQAAAPDAGLAYVVVTHQHAGHVSLMPELLGNHTQLRVVEASDGVVVEANHVYLSPPGARVALAGRALQVLADEGDDRSLRAGLPIDCLFRSLADQLRERAIVVVLSGTGSDGTAGAKLVKRESGLVMVEDPSTATYDGMPRSVISMGLADYVETASELAARTVAYASRRFEQGAVRSPDAVAEELSKVLALLRARTGHDFSCYKESTVRRRVGRRMNLLQIESAGDYVRHLHGDPQELDYLFNELLIGVTTFFRDPNAFAALATRLPEVLASKADGDSVRVWVPGCSTGEEAYSIAILLREETQKLSKRVPVQIFATDLDPRAIDVARAGLYPEGIAIDVGKLRLDRFFSHEQGEYRVCKEIRDMVVFAQQNVIADPPFTRLDLLSCRNLLIYLNSQLQQRLLPLFHYALRPGGLLFLGTSESVGGFAELFSVVDKKWKLFERVAGPRPAPPFSLSLAAQEEGAAPGVGGLPHKPSTPPMSKVVEKLLVAEHVPPTVVVNDRGTIVHIHGRTGLFLEPAPGQPSLNLLDMAREGLRGPLATGLRQAALDDDDEGVRYAGVRVRTNGDHALVDVEVRRLSSPEPLRGLFLVSFRVQPKKASADAEGEGLAQPYEGDANQLDGLEHELRFTKETLQSAIEELEASNEELKSTNEELQSTNEELQSANEELETSKEEMQSLNEELHTVNSELEDKVTALSQANDDMTNLLNSTEIATIFLDNNLHVKRFTEAATRVIKLIRTDVGRPIGDLASELDYDTLIGDARDVSRTLIHKERELQSKDGSWFLMRIVPYRTTENVIDGLVMTFVDITEQKRSFAKLQEAQDDVRRSEETLQATLATSSIRVNLARVDGDLRYTWVCNPDPDLDPSSMIGKRDDEVYRGEGGEALLALKRRVARSGKRECSEITLEVSSGSHRYRVCAQPHVNTSGEVVCVSTIAINVDDLKATQPAEL